MPTAPNFATIDTSRMLQVINPPVYIDTRKYQAIAIESMVRQIDQQNRAALSHVPVVPCIPACVTDPAPRIGAAYSESQS